MPTPQLEDIQLKTTGKWSCANVNVNSVGSVVPAIPACPIGPNTTEPRPAPPPPPPGPQHDCQLLEVQGCYADAPTKAGSGVLSRYQPQLHDIVTQGNCASACFNAQDSLAGIDVRLPPLRSLVCLSLPLRLQLSRASLAPQAGNHCWCGSSITAGAKSEPSAECQASACKGNETQKCGGHERMMVYSFACDKI